MFSIQVNIVAYQAYVFAAICALLSSYPQGQASQTLNASTIEGASCNETVNNCYIICDGDDRCRDANIACPTNENCEYCSLNCTGVAGERSSCESSIFYGYSCKNVEIFLKSRGSGKRMTVYAPSDGVLKVTATDLNGDGDETLKQSQFYSSTNTEAMYFYIYNSNGDKEFEGAYINASNANYLELNCYNSAQCDEMTIYCPSNSTLNDDYFDNNNNPRPCTINCDGAICEPENVLEIVSHWEDDIDLTCSGGSSCNFTINCNGGSCITTDGNSCSGDCQPTAAPTFLPSVTPSNEPTSPPSFNPSTNPTQSPSNKPTTSPSMSPTSSPTDGSTARPTGVPTSNPNSHPTQIPSTLPNSTSPPNNEQSIMPSYLPSETALNDNINTTTNQVNNNGVKNSDWTTSSNEQLLIILATTVPLLICIVGLIAYIFWQRRKLQEKNASNNMHTSMKSQSNVTINSIVSTPGSIDSNTSNDGEFVLGVDMAQDGNRVEGEKALPSDKAINHLHGDLEDTQSHESLYGNENGNENKILYVDGHKQTDGATKGGDEHDKNESDDDDDDDDDDDIEDLYNNEENNNHTDLGQVEGFEIHTSADNTENDNAEFKD